MINYIKINLLKFINYKYFIYIIMDLLYLLLVYCKTIYFVDLTKNNYY
jgi:hypothetical protein